MEEGNDEARPTTLREFVFAFKDRELSHREES
jgi:hypothetical protein